MAADPYNFSVIGRNGNGWCPGTHRNETINVPFLVNNTSYETSQFPKFCLGFTFQNLKKCHLLSHHHPLRHLTPPCIGTKRVPGQITHCMLTNLCISFKPPYKKTSDVQAFNKHHPAIFTATLHLLLIFQTHTPPVLRNYTSSNGRIRSCCLVAKPLSTLLKNFNLFYKLIIPLTEWHSHIRVPASHFFVEIIKRCVTWCLIPVSAALSEAQTSHWSTVCLWWFSVTK